MSSTTGVAVQPRKLGLPLATTLVIGNMIGSGVFLLPAALASYGTISLVGWGFTAAGAILLALVFAKLARQRPAVGGPYAYSREAFGDFVGFQIGWGYWIAIWVGNAAIAVTFVSYLSEFWGELNTTPVLAAGVAIAAIWLLTAINVLGVRQGGIVQGVTTVLKLIPLVGIAVVGMFFISGSNFPAFNTTGGSSFSAITAAAALTLWAFIGLESATVPAKDVRDPERNIPRATIIGTLLTAAVYILGTVAVMGTIPAAVLAESNAPFADAASSMFGPWASRAVTLGVIVSTFGALNGWILLQGQVPLAAARDRLLPSPFGRLGRSGAPVFGLVVSSVLVTGLMAMNYTKSLVDQFEYAILLATLTTLVPYAYSAMAQVILFVRDRRRFSVNQLRRDIVIASLAFAYSVWAIAGAGYEVVFFGFLLLMAGIPVYVWMRARDRRGDLIPETLDLAEPAPNSERIPAGAAQ